jgi:hypothetical protein
LREAGGKVADIWEYLSSVRQIMEKLRADDLEIAGQRADTAAQIEAVYQQSEELGDLAGLSRVNQKDWVETMVEASQGVMGQYANYLNTIQSRQEIEKLVIKLEKEQSELADYLRKGLDQFPLIYLTAAHINDQGKENTDRPALGWYKESLVLSAAVSAKIDSFFDRLKSRTTEPELTNFLEDLRSSLQLLVVDCVNIANGFYIHILEEDCAVLLSQAEFNLRDPAEHAAVMQRILQLEQYPVFGGNWGSRFFPEMKKQSRKRQGVALVPCFLSVVDVREFLKFFDRYWTSLLDGLKVSEVHDSEMADHGASTYIKLKGAAKIQCRPQPLINPMTGQPMKQARIAILGEGNFAGFDIRVDMNGRGELELDLGGVTSNEALAS